MRSTGRSIFVAVSLALGALSCDSPTGLPTEGARLVWVSAPPLMLREGGAATVSVELRDGGGRALLTLDGAPVTLRLEFATDSQPGTSCGDACTATVSQGRAEVAVAWVSAGSWTAIACVRPAAPADSACVQAPFTVLPVQAALVSYPADSITRRVGFPLEARLRLSDGTSVNDIARPVRLRFTSSAPPADHVLCPEAGPVCERVSADGVVRLENVLVQDTATTTIEACAVAPNGHERCDSAGPRAFRVVMPAVTLRFVTEPGGGPAGVPFATQPVIEALEPDGTRRLDFTGLVAVALADQALGSALAGTGDDGLLARGTVTARAVGGLVTFTDLRVNQLGLGQRLVASSPGAAADTSGLFGAIFDAAALTVAKVAGDSQYTLIATAVPVDPKVIVTGPLGDPVGGVPVSFSLYWGSIVDSVDVTDADGIATPGAWTLQWAGMIYPGPQRHNFLYVSIGPDERMEFFAEVVEVTQIVFVSPPTDVTAGDTISPAVTVELQDYRGRPVLGNTGLVTLHFFRIVSEYGDRIAVDSLFGGTLVRAAVDGRVTFDDITATRAGPTVLQVQGTTAAVAEQFFSVLSDSTTLRLVAWRGDGQSATVGTAVPVAPAAGAFDAYGNSFQDTVTYTVTSGGGSIAFVGGTNGQNIREWVLGPVPGLNTLQATSRRTNDTVSFSATGKAPTVIASGVSAGTDFTCATAQGTGFPYCWGANDYGQLGDGTMTTRDRPTLVGGGLFAFTEVSAGLRFACGLIASGAAYCWGDNSTGQLGRGNADSSWTPVAVAGGHIFQQVEAGASHACALDAAGVAWCWGTDGWGQLGNGTSPSSDQLEPVQVNTLLRFTQIVTGAFHTCGIAESGQAWCWGYNLDGRGGDGTATSYLYSPAPVAGARIFTRLSAGAAHTCGVSVGSVYCWGRNNEGQLGTGATSTTPSREPVNALGALGTTMRVAAGGTHSCALNSGGETYCWGLNTHGQLGDGSTTQRTSGSFVSGGNLFVAITAGQDHTCGVRQNGETFCWGWSYLGRLGIGMFGGLSVTTPVEVVAP